MADMLGGYLSITYDSHTEEKELKGFKWTEKEGQIKRRKNTHGKVKRSMGKTSGL